jgi:hypothetical protein
VLAWDRAGIEALIGGHLSGCLFIAGCVANQGEVYPGLDAVVLPSPVLPYPEGRPVSAWKTVPITAPATSATVGTSSAHLAVARPARRA